MASSVPSASAERNPFGKTLNSQTKYLLMKLWEYFKQEAKKCKISINIMERISKATGISRTSIRMEHRKKGDLFTPRKRYKCSRVLVDTDSFNPDTIRQDPFIVRKGGNLSLSKILAKLKNDGVFSGGRTLL
ncbi:uncharacterized protein [Dysidea avara]|uniref:uncharacterized protein n=1 Tax=Dysidea avara TaxID=196820 RepID=UPI0033288F96